MKIAIVVRRGDKRGGISRYAVELAEQIAINNEVHIYAASCTDFNSKLVSFHKIPMLSSSFLKEKKIFSTNVLIEIVSFGLTSRYYVNKNTYDIIHSNGNYFGHIDIFTAHSCHAAWLKLSRQNAASLIHKIYKSPFNPLHHQILKSEKYSINHSKHIIAVSQGVKQEIIENYKIPSEKISVIPNGVDINRFHPNNKKTVGKEIREKFNLLSRFTIIFSGHEFYRKGLAELIQALKIINRDDVAILVLGRDNPAPYQKLAKNIGVEKNVIFAGEVTNVEKFYAAGDIFVCPTKYESFLFAAIEAASSGLPILSTRVNGVEDYLIDGNNGFFISSEPEDIASKIMCLYDDNQLRIAMGKAARQKAEEYSWDKIAQKTFSLYQQITEQK